MTDLRRHLPSVDRALASTAFAALLAEHPRQRIVHHLRSALDHAREDLARGTGDAPPDIGDLAGEVEKALVLDGIPSLRPVINATGVVLHTNLGRAPIAPAARSAMARAARGYGNLEFDLERGSRGSRYVHCVQLLRELTGAEAALVVNNAAGALVLGMNTLAAGKEVAVSRGELVEIGGGFRIPDILVRSGVRLREVGSTNRTRIADYEAALETGEVAALLKVHRSNFRIEGFTEEAGVAELAELADRLGVHFFHDLGTGLMMDPAALGLRGEPRVADSLANGAHVVGFSGDKLLGGPQAGILVGRGEPIARMRQNPLCRSLRVDKVTLAGLEATLRLYRDPGRALAEIPALRMIAASPGGAARAGHPPRRRSGGPRRASPREARNFARGGRNLSRGRPRHVRRGTGHRRAVRVRRRAAPETRRSAGARARGERSPRPRSTHCRARRGVPARGTACARVLF